MQTALLAGQVGAQRQSEVRLLPILLPRRLVDACSGQTTLECRPSVRTATDCPGRCVRSYGYWRR